MKWILFGVILAMDNVEGLMKSPCPSVFNYEMIGDQIDTWYGALKLKTDYTVHGVWLNVGLDRKAKLFSIWIGNATTEDNIEFIIQNPKLVIRPNYVDSVKFFVQYSILEPPPKVKSIKFNGREICIPDELLSAVGRQQAGIERNAEEKVLPPVRRPIPIPTILMHNISEYRKPSGLVSISDVLKRVVHDRSEEMSKPGQLFNERKIDSFPPPSKGMGEYILNPYGIKRRSNFRRRNSFNQNPQCGKVARCYSENPNALVVKGQPTMEGQWPWQVALYKAHALDSKYQCGGTLITDSHVITAAHCVTHIGSTKLMDKNTMTVFLGKHNLRIADEGAQIRLVKEIVVHEQFDAILFAKDIAIVTLREPAEFTSWVQPACLWPEDQVDMSTVQGRKGSVVGWGYNENEELNEELSLVEMPVVDDYTCILSKRKFFALFTNEYTYCAGDKTGSSVCNGDSGSGMVFQIGSSWYLRGLVSLSVPRADRPTVCDPNHYIVFTDIAKLMPWVKTKIDDNY